MELVDHVVDRITEVVNEGRMRIAECAASGVSCEGWLKIELLKSLSESLSETGANEIITEADHFDLVVTTDSQTIRIELKTFPTNYGRSGKPITKSIEGVIRDLSKLSAKSGPTSVGLVVWLAYPIPEPLPRQWPGHLLKVQVQSGGTLRSDKIALWGNNFAHLYVMRCR